MPPLSPLLALVLMAEPWAQPPGAQLVIISESACPSSAAVSSALATLRPPAEWPAAVVGIRETAELMRIDVGARDPVRRELAVGPDCAARASAAALVIATWMSDLPSQGAGAPVLRAPLVPSVPVTPLPPNAPATGYEIGAALAGAVGGGFAPGVQLELTRLRPPRWLGWQASLAIIAPRELALGEAVTRWMRTSLAAGLHVRQSFARLFLAADAGLMAGYSLAWGAGYAADARDGAFVWGALAGMRAGLRWGQARVWLELRARRWLLGDTIEIASTSAAGPLRADLPTWEAQAALGVSYLLR